MKISGRSVTTILSVLVVPLVIATDDRFFNQDIVKNLIANSTKEAVNASGLDHKHSYCQDPTLATWAPPFDISKQFRYYHAGYDAENRPIWIVEFGRWDVRSLIEQGPEHVKALDQYARQTCYRALQSIKDVQTADYQHGEGILIIDAEGLEMRQLYSIPTVQFGLKLAREYRFLLTEHLGQIIFINANHVLSVAMTIARPILKTLFERIEVFGNNKGRWVPELLSRFPKSQLPGWYGGSKQFKPVAVYG